MAALLPEFLRFSSAWLRPDVKHVDLSGGLKGRALRVSGAEGATLVGRVKKIVGIYDDPVSFLGQARRSPDVRSARLSCRSQAGNH